MNIAIWVKTNRTWTEGPIFPASVYGTLTPLAENPKRKNHFGPD
jgi:hypothetical protein